MNKTLIKLKEEEGINVVDKDEVKKAAHLTNEAINEFESMEQEIVEEIENIKDELEEYEKMSRINEKKYKRSSIENKMIILIPLIIESNKINSKKREELLKRIIAVGNKYDIYKQNGFAESKMNYTKNLKVLNKQSKKLDKQAKKTVRK